MPFKKWSECTDEEKQATLARVDSMHTPEAKAKAAQTRRDNFKKRKCMRDLTRFMLEAELDDLDELKWQLEARGFEASEQGAMVYALMNKAKSGDVEAFKTLRDTSGQKPVEHQAVDLNTRPSEMDLSQLSTAELMEMYDKYKDEEET